MPEERMASLKALRDQAAADAERTQLALDSSGNQGLTPDMLKGFARKARERIRLGDGSYRRDHLRALAQRVEVADDERFASRDRSRSYCERWSPLQA